MFHNENQNPENFINEWMNDNDEKITVITTGFDASVEDFVMDIYVNHNLVISDVFQENLGMEMEFQGIQW